MQKSFVVYNDPAHGWAKVPQSVIASLGMKAADFSSYSYLDDGHIYLEEDADMSRFIEGFIAKHGERPNFNDRHCNGRSRVRDKWSNCAENARYFVPEIA